MKKEVPPRPLRILHVIDSLRGGGKERRLVDLLGGLRAVGDVEVEVFVLSTEVAYTRVWEVATKVLLIERRTKKDFRALASLLVECARFRPDVVHSWDSMSSVYALLPHVFLRLPLLNGMICDAPSVVPRKTRIRARLTFPLSTWILANSLAGLQTYHAPMRKSVYIHNGFDPRRLSEVLDEEEVRSRFEISTPYVVGMVASFTPEKDYSTYIHAAEIVLRERSDVTFVAVGDGPLLMEAEQMVHEMALKNFKFLGRQSNVETIENLFSVAVLSTFAEGLPNSILESMALGKPVVVSDAGGSGELVADEQDGFLVPVGDPRKLAHKIVWLLDNPESRKMVGEKARKKIFERFPLSLMTERFLHLYRSLARRRSPGRLIDGSGTIRIDDPKTFLQSTV